MAERFIQICQKSLPLLLPNENTGENTACVPNVLKFGFGFIFTREMLFSFNASVFGVFVATCLRNKKPIKLKMFFLDTILFIVKMQ